MLTKASIKCAVWTVMAVPKRGVRVRFWLDVMRNSRAPWPFNRGFGKQGFRTSGPMRYDLWTIPNKGQTLSELTPKFRSIDGGPPANTPELRDLTGCQPTGYTHPETGKFYFVPEMVPEIIAPDPDQMKSFPLKPYVSYKVDHKVEQRIQKTRDAAKSDKSLFSSVLRRDDHTWPPPKPSPELLFQQHYANLVETAFKHGKYDQDPQYSAVTQKPGRKKR